VRLLKGVCVMNAVFCTCTIANVKREEIGGAERNKIIMRKGQRERLAA
jgi:hypothetical protein